MKKLLYSLSFLSVLASCVDSPDMVVGSTNEGTTEEGSFDFPVPLGFDWTITSQAKVAISVSDFAQGSRPYGIEIYQGAVLLDRGYASPGMPFVANVNVLDADKVLTVYKRDANGGCEIANLEVYGQTVDYTFATQASRAMAMAAEAPQPVYARPEGCIILTTGMTLEAGQSYVVPQGATVDNVNFIQGQNDFTIYVEGTLNYNATWNPNRAGLKVYVAPSGKFTASSLAETSPEFHNWGQVSLPGGFTVNGTLVINNCGSFAMQSALMVPDNSVIYNWGDMTLQNGLYAKQGLLFENYSKFVSKGQFQLLNACTFLNTGNMEATGSFQVLKDCKFTNTGYVKSNASDGNFGAGTEFVNTHFFEINHLNIDGVKKFEVGGQVKVGAQGIAGRNSMITVKGMSLLWATHYCYISGLTLKLEPNAKVMMDGGYNGDAKISGDGNSSYGVLLASGFYQNGNKSITGKVCIDAKNNTAAASVYGEGVYTSNPGREIIHIPANIYNENGYNCGEDCDHNKPEEEPEMEYSAQVNRIMMEDVYPWGGDMDMNDIVIDWQLGMLKNKQNQVSQIAIKYELQAIGAKSHLGAGLRLNGLATSNISKVTLTPSQEFATYFDVRNGMEAGNSDVIIPLFEDAHRLFYQSEENVYVNTLYDRFPTYEFEVVIDLNTPMASSDIRIDMFDFFLVSNGDKDTRVEIHLHGNPASSKASNHDLFADNQKVWGVQYTNEVRYAKELTPITKAYPKFQSWVTSGGQQNADWYMHPNEDLVFELNETVE